MSNSSDIPQERSFEGERTRRSKRPGQRPAQKVLDVLTTTLGATASRSIAMAGLGVLLFLTATPWLPASQQPFPPIDITVTGPVEGHLPSRRATPSTVVTPSATCNEREPNETRTQANAVSIPGTCTGAVASTDFSAYRIDVDNTMDGIEDLFVLTLPVPGQLLIELSYTQSSADLDLYLFTPGTTSTSLRAIAASATRQPGTSERIAATSPAAAGTYYIGVSAFSGSSPYTLSVSAPGYSESCTPDERSLCLNNGRFRVTTHWRTADNRSGAGQSSLMTGDTGYFWFFDRNNVEAVVKVLDACSFNNRFWVFAGGLTDVEVQLRVTDTVTQASKEYTNPLGRAFQPVTDTGAFATCGGTAPPPPPCTYSISQSSRDVGSGATTGSFNITAPSHCSWTAVSNATWITVTGGATGLGNGTVAYSVAANTQTTTRSGTITAGGQTFTINQAASGPACTYTVSPTSQSFGASGGTGSISMTTAAGCSWTAASSASWITVTAGSSGNGSGTISYSVAAHSGTSTRTGTITAGGRTVSITQSGTTPTCTFTITFPNRNFGWCGGDATYTVDTASGCSFSVSSNVSWIQPQLQSIGRTDPREFGSFAVLPNTGAAEREGILTIAGQSFTIRQPGRSGSGQYDGVWNGTTNTGRTVTACVANNAVEALRITVRLDLTTFTCTTNLAAQSPISISGSSFSGRASAYPETSNIFTTVNGTFASSSSMSATWTSYSDSYYVVCGSTVGVGTGGQTLAAGSFTATKQ